MRPIRIATWNLKQYADNTPRAEARRAMLADVRADIWVLTEVHRTFGTSELPDTEGKNHPFQMVACSNPFSRFFPGVMVSIWAREDLQGKTAEIKSTELTACAEFPIIGSKKLWVYGTVLPWVGSAKSLDGYTFDMALAEQKSEWGRLNWQNNGWLCVAGDFNQEYSAARHFYGSGKQEALLKKVLGEADLECLTGGPTDPVAHTFSTQEKPVANIDHICMGSMKSRNWKSANILAWPRTSGSTEISDHHCVSVDIEIP